MNNEDKKWKRKFIAFLKKNGIYEKWIYNIKDQNPLTNYAWWNCFADRIYENKCSNGIIRAFYWVDTKDGHEFWSFYNIEWKRIVGNGDIQKMFQNAMTKEDKKWKRKFIAFLKENGIYEKWVYNMKDQHPTTNTTWWDHFEDSIYEIKSYEGINHAFTWADTKDGHEFWSFYNIEWKRIVGNGDIQKMFQNAMTNEDKEWKRKFIAFLKENGIYEKWIYNMKRQHPTIWNLFFHGIYENKCSNGISRAFYWVGTKDGHDYWRFYDLKWKRIVGNGIIAQ